MQTAMGFVGLIAIAAIIVGMVMRLVGSSDAGKTVMHRGGYAFAFFVAWAIVSSVQQQPSTGSAGSAHATAKADYDLDLVGFTWRKDGFGNIMMADFMIVNVNDFPVKDITITCVHTAPSGTVIDRNTRTIYERIEAKSNLNKREFNMGFIHTQVSNSTCHIDKYVKL